MKKELRFEFGWLALKLMGKSLYSNAWSAISELVANGFDANARNVYVLVDAVNKRHATIEILDDGDGMTEEGMDIYIRVGFNKRDNYKDKHHVLLAPESIMGRKGIGKLAALYLSSNYYVWTKPVGAESSCWEMNFPTKETRKNPSLKLVEGEPHVVAEREWMNFQHGTLIKMCNVNLAGAGEQAFAVLETKLANYFSLDAMHDRKIKLCLKTKDSESTIFRDVKKRVAFKNMAFITYSPACQPSEVTSLMQFAGVSQRIPYNKINDHHEHKIEVFPWGGQGVPALYTGVDEEGLQVSIPYKLTGWIGIHCTINKRDGIVNDKDFNNNHYYNPNQLRLYVRNKLAMENFLNVLNSTQTYANYIEGEIHFDLLDDDRLPDIATSNRQSVDEHDSRVSLLCALLQPIIRSLISKRVELAALMKKESEDLIAQRNTNAKQIFSMELNRELGMCKSLSTQERTEISTAITNKIKGNITIKDERVVFFSHSSSDKHFGDFFHELLLKRGVRKSEMFYTSRDDDPSAYADVHPLSDQIKRCIVTESTLLFYLVGYKYGQSQYCLFEGGAGWATRATGEYPVLSVKYDHIPKFLTNGKNEMSLFDAINDEIVLDRNNYHKIINVLNVIIDHINHGRTIRREQQVKPFAVPNFPDKVELRQMKKTEADYMDPLVLSYWKVYVEPCLEKYIKEMKKAEC